MALKFLLLLVCLGLPVAGFGQQVSSGRYSFCSGDATQTRSSSDGVDLRCKGLYTSETAQGSRWPPLNAVDQSTPAVSPGGKTPAPLRSRNVNGRPHLVELSSVNWHPLKNSEKFALFYRDLYSWGTHLSLAIDAGLSFATNDRSYLGPGVAGYFSRYGLNVADEANFTFFNAFFFPTIFHQDPRYIPLDKGPVRVRLAYAVSRVILTRDDCGKTGFNKSRILGTVVATSISSSYYASFGGATGVGPNFAGIGINLASEASFDVFKEFWPDLARKLKMNVWVRNLVRSSVRDVIRVQ